MRKREAITRKQIIEKFTAYLPTQGYKNQCWEWKGPMLNNGYGDLVLGSKKNKAPYFYRNRPHRFAYEYFFNKEIPKHLYVCHSCDNTKCCNPDHLFLGTPKDNMADKIKKGRHTSREEFSRLAKTHAPKGSRQPKAKLHEKDIPAIFELFKSGTPKRQIAFKFNVSPGAIGFIIARKTWKHVSIEGI
jgi:hypothetical protein